MRSGFVPFNALLISSVVLQQISFVIPTALLFNRRRSEEYLPPSRPLKLPNWLGWTANVIVVAMASLFTVFFVLPPFLPVTGSNMTVDYTCVILGIAAVLGIVNWFLHGRKQYQGPRIVLHD
ncbi:hypothetical protein DL95DRAFT_457333 [Leptodontidium sp. 2 PMI_412]|nr:hypothetical protein DL95DRAFT_457333 [Leptodontidium sp. 2 PMI_412]